MLGKGKGKQDMEKLNKYTLYVGLNDANLKYQTIPTEQAKKHCKQYMR